MKRKYSDKIAGAVSVLIFMLSPVFVSSAQEVQPPRIPSSVDTYKQEELSPSADLVQNSEQTLTMDLRGISIAQFLKVLSKKMNKNIIPTKKVSGKINLTLNKVAYHDALDLVMITQGLAYELKGDNLIIVMTESEYASLYGERFNEKKKMEKIKIQYAEPKMVFNALSKLKSKIGNVIVDESTGMILLIDTPESIMVMKNAVLDLDRTVTVEAFELQYAIASDVQEHITALITEGPGSVVSDERTNSLIITDLPGNMVNIRKAIFLLDQETKQVYIEAEIIQVTLSDKFNFGIDWNKIVSNYSFINNTMEGSFDGFMSTAAPSGDYFRLTLDGDDNWSAVINMLSDLGDVKILSSPRIAVTNNEEASLLVGTKKPYVTATTSQSGESTITSDSVEFIDIGIKLTVVPTINRDGFVTIKIKPEISSSTENLTTGTTEDPRSIIPIVTTSEAETTVKIKDGTTIMIAGLRESTDSKEVDGIPYLSQIPVVGQLFSTRQTEEKQTEIIIFLTPRIITGEAQESWDLQEMSQLPDHLTAYSEYQPSGKNTFNSGKLKRKPKRKGR